MPRVTHILVTFTAFNMLGWRAEMKGKTNKNTLLFIKKKLQLGTQRAECVPECDNARTCLSGLSETFCVFLKHPTRWPVPFLWETWNEFVTLVPRPPTI